VLSASALVVGVMCLVFGTALNPATEGMGMEATARLASEQSGRWLAMSVLYFCASVALTCGMPAVLSLFRERAHRLGVVAVAVFSVGAIGTSGFAMLLVFIQALAQQDALNTGSLEAVVSDAGLTLFLWGWAAGFYLGALLVALALLVSRATSPWVPVLLMLFVVLLPVSDLLGQIGQVVSLMALALAFTGIATAAVSRSQLTEAVAS
jgi:hypothetical protein